MTKILIDRATVEQALEALKLAQLNGEAGLRDYEVFEIAEAAVALKAALAEPVQEPVVWMSKEDIENPSGWRTVFLHTSAMPTDNSVPLYAAPPQRKPLSEEDIMAVYTEFMLYEEGLTPSELQRIVRAVERAHGIKE